MKKAVYLKVKKITLVLMAVLFVFSVVGLSFADPEYGLIKANKRKHIVRNFLYDSTGVSGWVTFACQSVDGFQYSVAVENLSPNTAYDVWAVSLATVYVPCPCSPCPCPTCPGVCEVPTSDGPDNTYYLGTITTNGKGEGEVDEGLIPLPPGLYGWEIKVGDATSGVAVLSTAVWDPIDFVVFPAWP